ncbi:MAG TPA: hypothetical protein DCQ26_04565 [Marinilabiliales bacterium]|nr:MAG: hypothetical protein A2W96_00110 [Bacteroidetes bacterium GWD2_40_43]OFY16455.1 MAG: hypothetical protein A2W88_18245 [Bacteroidetes bacterium GWF2_40_13]OFZ27196.1 MAG: hypothetical protein A2437_18810 [Bacteroidetes bacterium RIFOXYC2_FULL_40_12]HAM97862.1 hypothetical protein [Marinilabiliales bacterium]HBO73423.1 hypothetical protein [Marinilabiliales bacterium]
MSFGFLIIHSKPLTYCRKAMQQIHEFIKKAKLPENGIIINAPKEIEGLFLSLGYTNQFGGTKNTTAIIFLNDSTLLSQLMELCLKHTVYDSLIWICYPKGTSKVKTDLNRDILWELIQPFGVRPVGMVSVDATWSAMRIRPSDMVKSK